MNVEIIAAITGGVVLGSKIDALQPSTMLTLFHGTDATHAKSFLQRGIDATQVVSREHNQGSERGLYVTPSIACARDFGSVVFQISVRASMLFPAARWGVGSGHRDAEAKRAIADKFPNSFRPLVSYQLRERIEPQAMLIGFVPVSAIKAVYVFKPMSSKEFEKLSVTDAKMRLQVSTNHVDWVGNESVGAIFHKLEAAYGLEHDELLDILKDSVDSVQQTLTSMGLPRKLRLRVLDYVKHH